MVATGYLFRVQKYCFFFDYANKSAKKMQKKKKWQCHRASQLSDTAVVNLPKKKFVNFVPLPFSRGGLGHSMTCMFRYKGYLLCE